MIEDPLIGFHRRLEERRAGGRLALMRSVMEQIGALAVTKSSSNYWLLLNLYFLALHFSVF